MNRLRTTLATLTTAALVLGVAFVLGPRAGVDGPVEPVEPRWDIEAWIAEREAAVDGIRPGDGKTLRWAGGEASHTELSVVYLHGFSADRHEISPVPERVAEDLDANLFLTRLTGHGRGPEAMAEATARDWLQDAEEAMTVGTRLGGRVVLMGTSTGGTLALWVAAQDRWRDRLAAVILVSPNLGVRDGSARFLLWPWGGLLARLAVGPERCFEALNDEQERHWTTCYPTRALLPMMALVEHVRSMEPGRVGAPVLVLYDPGDQVVDAGLTEEIVPRMGSGVVEFVTPEHAEDPSRHVLAGDIVSPASTDEVVGAILEFLARRSVAGPASGEPTPATDPREGDPGGSASRD